MTFDVIIFKQTDDGSIARPALWADEAVYGATEQEALDGVQALSRDLLNRMRFVQVEVDVPAEQSENPWLAKAGKFSQELRSSLGV